MYVWDTRLRFFNSLLFSILSVLYTFNFSGLFNSILRQSLPPFYRGCHRFTVYTSPYALDYCAACCLSLYLPSPDSNFLPCFIFLIGSTFILPKQEHIAMRSFMGKAVGGLVWRICSSQIEFPQPVARIPPSFWLTWKCPGCSFEINNDASTIGFWSWERLSNLI